MKTKVLLLIGYTNAARHADNIIVVKEGQVHTQGIPSEVMQSHIIEEVFGLKNQIMADPVSGTPLCVPIGRYKQN